MTTKGRLHELMVLYLGQDAADLLGTLLLIIVVLAAFWLINKIMRETQ